MKVGLHMHRHVVAAMVTAVVLCHAVCDQTRADDVRPAYLDIEELEPGALRVTWKVPLNVEVPARFGPSFPESFTMAGPGQRVETATALVEKWTVVCGTEPLAAATIGIEGLEETAMDALVRIQLADGSSHRVVLRPTATSTEVSLSGAAGDERAGRLTSLLRPTSRWLYPLLLAVAWLLSLTPRAARRGILLCAAALVAGSVCGHALGGLPLREKLLGPGLPSDPEARRVLRGLMLNTYRAFILEDEEAVYDVLARSVAGEYLSEVYLESREALRMDDSDAALSIVDRLDVRSIESMERSEESGVTIVASWEVYGSVFHWGHIHFRCNTYRAQVTIVPADGYWKLTDLQVLDQERVI
ncbi:MAG: hypothetical protein ACYSUR_13215 [Planctomycetota bacterium]|jgi:hypothetical protein